MKLKFVIAAHNRPDVLPRVVLLFHRAAVEIESIRMPTRRKTKSDLKITITVQGHQAHSHRMAAMLDKLVDVLSVEMNQSAVRRTARVQTKRTISRRADWIAVRPEKL